MKRKRIKEEKKKAKNKTKIMWAQSSKSENLRAGMKN